MVPFAGGGIPLPKPKNQVPHKVVEKDPPKSPKENKK